jgi:hypothetical protein
MVTKLCSKCQETKVITDFEKCKTMKHGYRNQCRICRNKEKNELRKSDKSKRKTADYWLRSNYNISLVQKEEMFKEQNEKCYTCHYQFKNISEACVDHNHITNKVRKLLCDDCNIALGLLKEDLKAVNNLVKYIQEDRGW